MAFLPHLQVLGELWWPRCYFWMQKKSNVLGFLTLNKAEQHEANSACWARNEAGTLADIWCQISMRGNQTPPQIREIGCDPPKTRRKNAENNICWISWKTLKLFTKNVKNGNFLLEGRDRGDFNENFIITTQNHSRSSIRDLKGGFLNPLRGHEEEPPTVAWTKVNSQPLLAQQRPWHRIITGGTELIPAQIFHGKQSRGSFPCSRVSKAAKCPLKQPPFLLQGFVRNAARNGSSRKNPAQRQTIPAFGKQSPGGGVNKSIH